MEQGKENVQYWVESANLEWYTRQFDNPYRITIAFEQFLSDNAELEGKEILDIGCGSGSATHYIAQKHPSSHFTGIDINTELFKLNRVDDSNIKLKYGDIFNLDQTLIGKFQGVISLQTLSWLPEYRHPLEQICKLEPEWIAFSSLLYDGKINYTIRLDNYERPTEESDHTQVFYNIYSVPKIAELLKKYGYEHILYHAFEIDMDIKKPDHKNLGYYTIRTAEGKRMAFNTCLYQPEGFIFASR